MYEIGHGKTFFIASALMLAASVGCHVDTHKNGNSDDVRIATPFGGLSVKTNDADVQGSIGLSAYPGAVLMKKEKGDDDSAADVNMSFGSFHLGVKAVTYRTSDSPDSVLSFYRKDMARYGVVILCRGNQAVGTPDVTQSGLTCEQNKQGKVRFDEEKSTGELKAGSKSHQHIVNVAADGPGTKISLVALELPEHLTFDDEKRNKQ